MPRHRILHLYRLPLLCGLALTLGCSGRRIDYRPVGLIEVTGVVTLDGRPLPHATVIFEADDRTHSRATTEASGKYRLRYNSEQLGVTRGWKTVRISTCADRLSDVADPDAKSPSGASPELLPARYNVRSVLKVVVESNTPTFDFALDSRP